MEQVTSRIIPFCGEWLLVITRTIRRHNVVGEGRRLNILQYADITPCLPDQWGPMNMLLGKDKYTPHTTKHAARKFEREYIYMQAGNHLLSKDEWTFIHQQCCSSNGWTDRRRLFKKKRPRHYQASFGQRYSFPFPFLIRINSCITRMYYVIKNEKWKKTAFDDKGSFLPSMFVELLWNFSA